MAQALNITTEKASEQLETTHNADKETRIQRKLERQIRQDQEAEDLRLLQAREHEEQRLDKERREEMELEKKKPEINDFDEDRALGTDMFVIIFPHVYQSMLLLF